jgi:hypothetical protein
MQSVVVNPAWRLWTGCVLIILATVSCPIDFEVMGELPIWRRFWLAFFSAAAIVTRVPVFWQGKIGQRVLTGVLLAFPLSGLFQALVYLFFEALD